MAESTLNLSSQMVFKDNGITNKTSCRGTLQQNSVVKMKNKNILETTRAFMIGASVLQHKWIDTMIHAIYPMN